MREKLIKMPKRTIQEKIDRYHRKLRKLEESDRGRKKRVIYSNDENDEDNNGNIADVMPVQEPMNDLLNTDSQDVLAETNSEAIVATADEAELDLDPELLSALGESTSDSPEFGAGIHDNLAKLWLPLLKKGMVSEKRIKILQEYLVPDNCRFLKAPILNAEISAAVSEMVRNRDKKLVHLQQQLGTGITAINRAMDELLRNANKAVALKYLSDSCRILSDLHFIHTKDRMKLIAPSLEKTIMTVIQEAERDDLLFGNTLADKIKASKAIEKQGQSIKKVTITQVPKPAAPQPMVVRPAPQGNWTGPPRYPSNRGGRGGHRKPPQPARRPPPPPPTYPKPVNKPRATQH